MKVKEKLILSTKAFFAKAVRFFRVDELDSDDYEWNDTSWRFTGDQRIRRTLKMKTPIER